jgi:carbamoyltransferase
VTVVCGIKLTHDGGVAVVDTAGDAPRLLFAVEAEKMANRPRHASLTDLALLEDVLALEGVTPDDIDVFVVDGWGRTAQSQGIVTHGARGAVPVRTAPYRQADDDAPPFHRYAPTGRLELGGLPRAYFSYRHVEGHVAAAYLTSPAAAEGISSFVLVWDGGVLPELYHLDPEAIGVEYLGPLLHVRGELYSTFVCRLEPFKPDPAWDEQRVREFHLSVAGKAMAYAGLGEADEAIIGVMADAMADALTAPERAALAFTAAFERRTAGADLAPADVLASFQMFIGRILIEGVRERCRRANHPTRDLCFAGGCALNIKWNSALRRSGPFDRVWVPPMPNDSGSAMGAACAELLARSDRRPLRWSVYCGPRLRPANVDGGWSRKRCSADELGVLLARTGEPAVALFGRAEIGPRALGHRSILAAPWSATMRDRLNDMKQREPYRPVAPICQETAAPAVFDPGITDPYMLFDHRVRDDWRDRIPAVVHADGTARLQTMSERQCPVTTRILRAFARESGLPVLCNTSANLPGCGVFPDVASCLAWGRIGLVWSDGTLYAQRRDRRMRRGA